jgi:guanylate kinase
VTVPPRTSGQGAPRPTRPGRLVVVSAPSGAGKTSLVRALLESDPRAAFSISYTTRPPRHGEIDGRDYFFVPEDRFLGMVAAGEFIEHARVFGNLYGTSRRQVEILTGEGRDVLLEIDWQGARQIRQAMPDCVSIFVLPPSTAELERRLRGRSTDSEATIRRRLADARDDMSHWHEFDYAVVNEDFDAALGDMRAILDGAGEHLRCAEPAHRRRIVALTA